MDESEKNAHQIQRLIDDVFLASALANTNNTQVEILSFLLELSKGTPPKDQDIETILEKAFEMAKEATLHLQKLQSSILRRINNNPKTMNIDTIAKFLSSDLIEK